VDNILFTLAVLAMQQVETIEELQTFAVNNKVDAAELFGEIIRIGESFWGHGKANSEGFTLRDADKEELLIGSQIEMEHTTDNEVARRIALDHLSENPKYYTEMLIPAEGGVRIERGAEDVLDGKPIPMIEDTEAEQDLQDTMLGNKSLSGALGLHRFGAAGKRRDV